MSNNCCNEKEMLTADDICPGCEKRAVGIETVKAMVNLPLWDIELNDKFFFDDDADSQTVYFSIRSGVLIDESDIREKVFAKHSDEDDTFVCYCFRVTVGDLRQASPEERANILAKITASSAKGQCSCQTRNPKGSCCISDVKMLIEKFADSNN